ncbi:MAG: nucleotide exchange factor GrpE [Ruminococcaceae bacterium]|nr:nucleotide exchange factor GrpE [Oscillospiraceae bacterium]
MTSNLPTEIKRRIIMEENKAVDPEELETQEPVQDAEAENENVTAEECAEECEKSSGKDKKKTKKLESEIEKLNASLAEEQDKYMRLYAEYDNFRRRSAKEREGIYTDAYCDALLQILPILDTLERAAQFSAEDAESPMAKGLELTLKSFVETMNKMGVYEIEALGKEFDPNIHNAVMHVDDESVGENIVVEVFMKGYKKGDKILRHSMVKVAN